METITLRPITDENREAVLALTVRDDQPFVAPNDAFIFIVLLRRYSAHGR